MRLVGHNLSMKLILSLLALAALLTGVPLGAESKPDFTGAWKLNVAKSDLGGRPITELTLVIEHKDPSFKYDVTGVADGRNFEHREEITTDSQPAESANGTVATAHWDGSVLVIEAKSAAGEVIENTRLSMSADGKTMVREGMNKGPDGDAKIHELYEKQ